MVPGVAGAPTNLKIVFVAIQFSSVQFSRSVVSDSLRPHESQHARPPCPSPTPGVHSNSCPLSWWCHPAISSSVVPFSSCPQEASYTRYVSMMASVNGLFWIKTSLGALKSSCIFSKQKRPLDSGRLGSSRDNTSWSHPLPIFLPSLHLQNSYDSLSIPI